MNRIRSWQKASYTVEAAIYIPMLLFLMFGSLRCGISFWQESKNREVLEEIQSLDAVSEFYHYQILKETGEEILDD